MSKFFLLTYKYVPDVLTKRVPLRAEHLQLAQRYASEGKILLGGALTDPVDSAAVIFKTDTKEDIEKFVEADPYVQKGIVTEYKIREWNVVVGSLQDAA